MKYLMLFAFAFSVQANAQSLQEGQKLWTEAACNTCHSLTSKKEPSHMGPALYGVTKKAGRSKEWLINWIANPDEMGKTDALAKKMIAENNNMPMTPMLKMMNKKADGTPDMAVVKKKAESLYLYLQDNDSKPEAAPAKKKKG